MRRLNNYRKIEAKRREEEAKKYEEDRKQEQARRDQLRKEWFAANKPKFYYNTVSGVTAVLRPADYETCQKDTKHSRRNGFWEKDNVLLLACETIVFVTKQGREMIDVNTGSYFVGHYKVAGYISLLDDIVEKSGAELVRAEDIFVPWVNETIIPFAQQAETLKNCHSSASYYEMVEKQALAELQPLW